MEGYTWAGSQNKWLRFITGRHDLPFYYEEEVKIQKGFLDAFLKGQDDAGWTSGKVAPVSLALRKGDKGFNNALAEKEFERRDELEWPIARTQYQNFFITLEHGLNESFAPEDEGILSYQALGHLKDQQLQQFCTAPFDQETEITGHIVAHLNLSLTRDNDRKSRSDIDVFVTLRHLGPEGEEIFYTGSSGDNVPLTKGWLRLSLRQVNENHKKHRSYLPHREYKSTDLQPVEPDTVYAVDVELWPTNVIIEKGGQLVFEVSSGDTQGCGLFQHTNQIDRYDNFIWASTGGANESYRSEDVFAGRNNIHFGSSYRNYVTLPIIPGK